MGIVFLAHDTLLGRDVAWKILPPELSERPKLKDRLLSEARAVAAVDHPNIIKIYDIGEQGGTHFISFEYVDGVTLRDYLKGHAPLEPHEIVTFMRQIASGLAAVHAKGVVHRDIKPENIIVSSTGDLKITDFGIAYLSHSAASGERETTVMGSRRYMSPEQSIGAEVDPRTDIYSLGVVAYEMATGNPPFTTGDLAAHHLHTQPTPLQELRPELPRALCEIIHTCLAKDRGRRYPTAQELVDALDRLDI